MKFVTGCGGGAKSIPVVPLVRAMAKRFQTCRCRMVAFHDRGNESHVWSFDVRDTEPNVQRAVLKHKAEKTNTL